MKNLYESLFDIDDNMDNLTKKVDLYDLAIKYVRKHKGEHPNNVTSFLMEMDFVNSNEEDIRRYLLEVDGDLSEEMFAFYKVIHELMNIDRCWSFCSTVLVDDDFLDDKEYIYSVIEPLHIYNKLTNAQASAIENYMFRSSTAYNNTKWQFIPDSGFDDQVWMIRIPTNIPAIYKRVLEEWMKANKKLQIDY